MLNCTIKFKFFSWKLKYKTKKHLNEQRSLNYTYHLRVCAQWSDASAAHRPLRCRPASRSCTRSNASTHPKRCVSYSRLLLSLRYRHGPPRRRRPCSRWCDRWNAPRAAAAMRRILWWGWWPLRWYCAAVHLVLSGGNRNGMEWNVQVWFSVF